MCSSAFLQVVLLVMSFVGMSTALNADVPELKMPGILADPVGITFGNNMTKMKEGTVRTVEWTTTLPGAYYASYTLENNFTANVTAFEYDFDIAVAEEDSNVTGKGSFNVTALFVGFNTFNITIYDIHNNTLGGGPLPVTVLLSYQKLNSIFTYILSALVTCVYVTMGATIDLEVVKQIVKRPVGPLVGIISQYGIMPLLAFGLAKLLFPGNALLQLGLFVNGASPGGGNSNMWTFLLGGSLDLSIMMTFASTVCAFAALPLWVLTMGPLIIGEDSSFTIPYSNIAMLVVLLLVPCSFGVFIQKKLPRVAKILTKILAPFSMFNIIFIGSVGIYSYRYVFRLQNWRILTAGFGLPFLGYLCGFTLATVTRRPRRDIIAIAVETGLQNAALAIIILKFTLDSPAGDLAVVLPTTCVLMTPWTLVLCLLIKKLYVRFAHSGGKDFTKSDIPPDQKLKTEPACNGYVNEVAQPQQTDKQINGGTNGAIPMRSLEGVDNSGADLKDV